MHLEVDGIKLPSESGMVLKVCRKEHRIANPTRRYLPPNGMLAGQRGERLQ
jgi:hypothetical protein